jgi:Flp pilus assembly protein TadD
VKPAPPTPKPAAASRPATAAVVLREAEQLHKKGRALIDEGLFRQAVAALSDAIALNPAHAQALNARGFAYLKLKEFRKAIADTTEAIRVKPDYANAYHNRAVAKRLAGDQAGAAADLIQKDKLSR